MLTNKPACQSDRGSFSIETPLPRYRGYFKMIKTNQQVHLTSEVENKITSLKVFNPIHEPITLFWMLSFQKSVESHASSDTIQPVVLPVSTEWALIWNKLYSITVLQVIWVSQPYSCAVHTMQNMLMNPESVSAYSLYKLLESKIQINFFVPITGNVLPDLGSVFPSESHTLPTIKFQFVK